MQSDFLKNGGYPETISQRTIASAYLQTLFDSIVYRDVVRRHKVRKAMDLNNVAMFLLSNFTGTFSYNNVAEDLGLSSVGSTKKFMDYLHEPFLFYYLDRYDNKLKLMKRRRAKYMSWIMGLLRQERSTSAITSEGYWKTRFLSNFCIADTVPRKLCSITVPEMTRRPTLCFAKEIVSSGLCRSATICRRAKRKSGKSIALSNAPGNSAATTSPS